MYINYTYIPFYGQTFCCNIDIQFYFILCCFKNVKKLSKTVQPKINNIIFLYLTCFGAFVTESLHFQNQPTITNFYIPVPSMTYLKTITFQCNFLNDRNLNSGERAKIERKASQDHKYL